MIRRIALQSTRAERLLPDLAVASAVERLNKKGLGEGARQGLLAIAGLGARPPHPPGAGAGRWAPGVGHRAGRRATAI